MSTIINLRGTNASGKTTAACGVMDYFLEHAEQRPGFELGGTIQKDGRVVAHLVTTHSRDLIVLGNYTSVTCGGCDTLSGFDEIKQLVRTYSRLGNVLFEGVLWSTVFRSSLELAQEMGTDNHHFIFATLDTPEDVCIARLRQRNEAKADAEGKPVKYSSSDGLKRKIERTTATYHKLKNAGLDSRWIDYRDPVTELVTMLGAFVPVGDELVEVGSDHDA